MEYVSTFIDEQSEGRPQQVGGERTLKETPQLGDSHGENLWKKVQTLPSPG